MNGWAGKILKVDLTGGSTWREDISAELLHQYLGGRGLGVRLMRDRFRLDPFDPDTPLIFATGPLCGTKAPASARVSVVSRSPLTGTVFSSSLGGVFALRLKGAGLDALHITGESRSPVVLTISGGNAALIPADILWGKDVTETVLSLAERGSVAAIGPAGENGVLFAGIMTGEGNSTARGGLGAVMGRKRLKAVVVAGDAVTSVADEGRLDLARQDVMRLFRASPVLFGELGIAEYGTAALVDLIRQRRMTPTRNFSETFFAGSSEYSGPAIRREFEAVNDGCFGCPIRCGKSTPAGDHLPAYDTLSHFGALNGIKSLPDILRASRRCYELGLDTVSAAATLSAWGEWRGCFAKGEEMPGLLEDIALARGEGDLLARGSARAMEVLGAPHLSMSVKSLELPAYDPRGAYGLALAYCTSNRGGCHMDAFPISHEILRKPVATDRFSFSGKARINKIAEDTNAAVDSLIACRFAFLGATLEEYAELLNSATGLEYTPQSLEQIGERIFLSERFYNCANGFSAAQDRLPGRFHTEAGSGGEGMEIPPVDRQRLDEELQKYYRMRGLTADGTFSDDGFLERLP
jgi:aldehyde:ferredoxin oxidoreductase